MLQSLSIKNFALIDELQINFDTGFCIITGETGAGKSIILGALELIMGKRAELSSLKNKEEKCFIETYFNIENYNLNWFFEKNNIDFDKITSIRREILPSGKSRAFINDCLVGLQELQELSQFLIDIHAQNQTHSLVEENYQFEILDAYCNNKLILLEFNQFLNLYKSKTNKLQELQNQLINTQKEQDYNLFLFQELQQAKLIENEQEELEEALQILSNTENIKENLTKASQILNSEQFGINTSAKELKFSLSKIANFSLEYQDLFQRFESISIELKDFENEIELLQEKVIHDPKSLEKTNQRLQLIYQLQNKHQVKTIAQLILIQNDLDKKVESLHNIENDIDVLKNEILILDKSLQKLSNVLNQNRSNKLIDLSKNFEQILKHLGIADAQFKIEILPTENYNKFGKNNIQFWFSANKGSDFGLMKKVASGGEMSRIMLAAKYVLAHYSKLPTIIFDEIDTGTSGEIASKISEILEKMSKKMQVFAITHLPQIASKGNAHYKVFKQTIENQTISNIKTLSYDERIIEIAQMLSGSSVTEFAIQNAKELLKT
jgi:DNA repair protein RecN (Recombination protein N)